MGEGADQAQRIDCLLEEGRNAETILQHTKKQVFVAKIIAKGDKEPTVVSQGGGRQFWGQIFSLLFLPPLVFLHA